MKLRFIVPGLAGLRTSTRAYIVVAILFTMRAATGCAQQLNKVALVIGNGNYQRVQRLANPTNDADLIASKLTSLGFHLVGGGAQKNLSLRDFKSAIQHFSAQASAADVGFFYYAGHGIQVNGTNYLVPTDANPVNGVSDVPVQMIDADSVLDTLDRANIRLKMVVFDSCRNNPFATRGLLANGLADMSRGLAGMTAPRGTVIWYATQPGHVAQDGTGNNGPFALAISHNIDTPGQDIYGFFNKTGLEVMNNTNPQQQPGLAATPLDGTFYFKQSQSVVSGQAVATPASIFRSLMLLQLTPVDRIRSLFSDGIQTPTRSFSFGETYQQVNNNLDSPFGVRAWKDLPQATEFAGREVRYLWVRLPSLPVVSSAIVPGHLNPGQCVDPNSYVVFLFEHEKLFSISIRLEESLSCPSYGWLVTNLFSSDHRSALIHGDQGDTTVTAHQVPQYTIIDISKLDSAKIWLD